MVWAKVDGRPECVGVTVFPRAASSGETEAVLQILQASLLRQIPIADWIAQDRAAMAPAVEATAGMRQSAVDRLREATEVYQAAVRHGMPPTKAVAARFGISSGGASNLVARARAAGLLPPTSPGKAAG
jgi:hypothetical protein